MQLIFHRHDQPLITSSLLQKTCDRQSAQRQEGQSRNIIENQDEINVYSSIRLKKKEKEKRKKD